MLLLGSSEIGRRGTRAVRPVRFRVVVVGIVAILIGITFVSGAGVQRASAITGSEFNAGYIIDDSKFYDSNAMSQAEIQSFLNSKQPGSCGSSGCLKSYVTTTTSQQKVVSSKTGNTICDAYAGGGQESAAAIIFKVQQACGISAKVIMVTMQKEEALITNTSPSAANLRIAMGYACPDHGAVCDTKYYGFFNQAYWGAFQLKTYRAASYLKQPGVNTIAYNPDSSCGSKTFVITNYATAALYNYTPYTPNPAALANLYGTAPCGAYGNRNFWVYFNSWFGGPTGNPQGALQATATGNNSVTVSGWAVDPDAPSSAISVRVRGAGWNQTLIAGQSNSSSQGVFPGAGTNHGYSGTVHSAVGAQQICVDAVNQGIGTDITIGCVSVTVPTALTSTRIQGTDRYDTAVQVSKLTAPGVPVVYVASGENFPDALSIAPAAAKQGVPLLLVARDAIPAAVGIELHRLTPSKIVVVGGAGVISDDVLTQLQEIAPTERLGGSDRYNTSIAVGQILGEHHSGRVFLAAASNFPDALSSASAAGVKDAPLVLVNGGATGVSEDLAAALQSWGVTAVTVVGGTGVISDDFMSELSKVPGISSVVRVSGTDRYQTSAAVNAATFPHPTAAFLAAGSAFPDGLSGGALAGKRGVPMYLVPGSCVANVTIDQLVASGSINVTVLGGSGVISSSAQAFAPC